MSQPIAIVTGAAGGIGRAIVSQLLARDFHVVGADIAWPGANGGDERITRIVCDVSKEADAASLFETIDRSGEVSALINAAGLSGRRSIAEMDEAEWNRVMNVNLHGTFLFTREAAKRMVAQRSGRIVNIASNRGNEGMVLGSHYAASKGAVIAFTKSVAAELLQFGIGVFAVLPGATDTPMFRQSRSNEQLEAMVRSGAVLSPDKVAETVLSLLAPEALAFSGAIVPVARQVDMDLWGNRPAPSGKRN